MNDLIGYKIQIDDMVAVTPKNYRGLVIANVIQLTDKKVRVEYNNTWNYGKPGIKETYLIEPNSCVIVNKLMSS